MLLWDRGIDTIHATSSCKVVLLLLSVERNSEPLENVIQHYCKKKKGPDIIITYVEHLREHQLAPIMIWLPWNIWLNCVIYNWKYSNLKLFALHIYYAGKTKKRHLYNYGRTFVNIGGSANNLGSPLKCPPSRTSNERQRKSSIASCLVTLLQRQRWWLDGLPNKCMKAILMGKNRWWSRKFLSKCGKLSDFYRKISDNWEFNFMA